MSPSAAVWLQLATLSYRQRHASRNHVTGRENSFLLIEAY